MSEKPFNFISEKRYFVNCALYLCDTYLDNTLSIFECADLLNQLTKENEQLKEENASLKQRIRDIKYNNCD